MEAENIITVIIKKVGQAPGLRKITPTLENFREIVGGNLQVVAITNSLMMYCDEEGKLKGKPINFILGEYPNTEPIVGDVVFFRQDGPDEASVDAKDINCVLSLIGWQLASETPTTAFYN